MILLNPARVMGTEKMVNEAATDRYSFIKNAYLRNAVNT
jgi:hypothetical protein